jgi:Carboxypeptidase regulatory-like domain/TonB dependent receptor
VSTRKAVAAGVLGFVFLLAAARGNAQEVDAAIVVGAVLDTGQAAVANATVKLTHLATNSVVEVHTNDHGEYRTPPLRLGEYEITVEAPGFKRFDQKGVVLNIGDVREVDATLEIGELSQTVTVESAAPLLQTQDSTVGTVITNQEITELPLNGRNYQQLGLLSAGTIPPLVNNVGISIGGQPSAQVAYLLDGQDNNNQGMSPSGNAGQKDIVEPSVDALQEFKVVTNGYSAEYGRSSSGVISAAIKSGSNQFHGEGFEFVRNAALDAENYFTPADSPKPPFGRNQFGGAIGGPILHDRTFFFGDVEFGRIRETYTSVNSLPDAAELAGQFPAGAGNPVIYDPSTPGVAFPIVNGQYVIPAGSIDPISQKVVNLLVSAGADPQTATANNFVYASPENTNAHRWDLRVDQIVSEKQNLYFRYSSQVDDLGITSLLPPAPGEGYFSYGPASSKTGAQTLDGTSFVLGYNRIWSPTVVTSVLAGWNDLFWNNNLPSQPLTGIGIPGVNETNPGFSGLLITGLPSMGVTNVPNTDISQNRQLSGDLTWTKGSHSIKFGVQEYWLQTNFHSSQTSGGTFTFNGQYTGDAAKGEAIGNPFADFLLGDASAASLSTYANLNFRIPETNLFVQDDWKVNRHLTLNIGLRYEITPPAVDVHNAIANYEMNTDPYVGTPQLVLAGANGGSIASRALQNVDYHQFAPRLGFAYSVGDKTVVRGGYGIFYSNVITVGGMSSLEKNPPDSVVVNENPSKTVPSVFLQDGFAANALSLANAKNVQLVSFDQRSVPPTDYQWNLNVQRQLPGGFLLEVGYVGNDFDHNWWSIDGNPAPLTATPAGSLNSRRIYTSAAVPGTPYTISLSNVKRIQKSGYSRYNALQTKLEKRYANGLSLIASYSYSKTMALGDAAGLQNPFDWAAEYAVAGQDVTQHFVGSAIYELPFGRNKKFGHGWNGLANAFLGGWAIDPIVTASTGFPVNLTESTDPSNTGQNDRPNVVGDWHLANPTVNEWFNTAAFATNAPGTFGDAKRNLLRAPGLFNIDLAAHKSFQITERVSAQLRLESFNFTNTPAFAAPDAVLGDPNFGRIQSAGNPRQVQLGVKVLF